MKTSVQRIRSLLDPPARLQSRGGRHQIRNQSPIMRMKARQK
jgi:hypothetical protein